MQVDDVLQARARVHDRIVRMNKYFEGICSGELFGFELQVSVEEQKKVHKCLFFACYVECNPVLYEALETKVIFLARHSQLDATLGL